MDSQNEIVAMVEKVIDACNRRDWDVVYASYDENFVNHALNMQIDETLQQSKDGMLAFVSNFPDIKMKIEDIVSQGTLAEGAASIRLLITGTGKGQLAGVSIDGKQASVSEFIIEHYRNGKRVEGWSLYDNYTFMVQLGLIPV